MKKYVNIKKKNDWAQNRWYNRGVEQYWEWKCYSPFWICSLRSLPCVPSIAADQQHKPFPFWFFDALASRLCQGVKKKQTKNRQWQPICALHDKLQQTYINCFNTCGFDYIILRLVLVFFWIIITRFNSLHRHEKNMNRKGRLLKVDFQESGSQSLLVIMASKNVLPSILEMIFFAVESKFLSILSIVASYVKSKCRALLKYSWTPPYDHPLIWSHHYYGQFTLGPTKARRVILLLKNPLNTANPLTQPDFCGLLVTRLMGFCCILLYNTSHL